MNAITYNIWNSRHLGLVILMAALINGLLFAALPWLTRIAGTKPLNEIVPSHIIVPHEQTKIPEPERKSKVIEQNLLPPPKPTLLESVKQNHIRDIDFVTGIEGVGDYVQVATLDPKIVSIDPTDIIFEPNQLDKEPRVIRKLLPIFPFTAKRQGIKARVKIRCLVDKDGMPQKVVATECDPEDALEIFGPPSVEAVKKWRFSPGEIEGDPVLTRVGFYLFFELDS